MHIFGAGLKLVLLDRGGEGALDLLLDHPSSISPRFVVERVSRSTAELKERGEQNDFEFPTDFEYECFRFVFQAGMCGGAYSESCSGKSKGSGGVPRLMVERVSRSTAELKERGE